MKLFYRNKILISGIFPMVNFKIDGYTEKTGLYDEKIIDCNNQDFPFYSAGHLLHSSYSCVGKNGINYEYFENDELFEYEINDKMSKEEIEEKFLQEQAKKISLLERKLRLITGFGITLPVFITSIYDESNNLYTRVGDISWQTTNLYVKDYNDDMKTKLKHRLSFYISDVTINELEEKNPRFKRALNFYVNSFDSFDIGIRFTLLFSSLEALFNITAENITDEVSKYSSKILFLPKKKANSSKWKIITYYDIRSKYIHGNDGFEITSEIENNLREYVREILIIYWNISMIYGITDAQKIKDLLDTIDNNSLNLQVQLFIKYLRTEPSKFNELYKKIENNFLNKDYQVLESKNFDIK